MIVVGLTGNLASGKGASAKIFKKLGARVLDADAAARKLTRKGTPLYRAIVKIFGKTFLEKGGQLDRRKLAWHVFSHPGDLNKLNILIHPGVIFEAYKAIEAGKRKKGVLVLDVPLLFESHMERMVDVTVVVKSSRERMLARAVKRGVPRPLAQKILASQWPPARKAALADFVIENNGSLARLEAGVKKVYREINKEKLKM